MRFSSTLRTGGLITAVLIGALCFYGQEPPAPPAPDALTNKAKGVPPRVSPAEYQAHAEAGTLTVAAEFMGHSVPTPDGTFSTEDYVVVEVGLFGPPEAKLKLNPADFSLRVNENKKSTLPSQPFEMVQHSLKDPEWSPPVDKDEQKSSTGISTGGGQDNSKPPPPKMPMPLVLAMDQKVQKARLPEGERALPQAGLLFFAYHGKAQSIHALELIYSGASGKATLALQP
ncbi:MAG: hypothetical protein WBW33_13175 [Bryobacteraceae bacterium]